MKTFFLFSAVLLLGTPAIASEEEGTVWSSVDVRVDDIRRAGPVVVSAKTADGRISKVTIFAFGRAHEVPDADLKTLSDFPLSSLRITHEVGYERLGGYSVHIRLRRVVYDAEKKPVYDADKKLRYQTAIVTVTEKNGLGSVTLTDK